MYTELNQQVISGTKLDHAMGIRNAEDVTVRGHRMAIQDHELLWSVTVVRRRGRGGCR